MIPAIAAAPIASSTLLLIYWFLETSAVCFSWSSTYCPKIWLRSCIVVCIASFSSLAHFFFLRIRFYFQLFSQRTTCFKCKPKFFNKRTVARFFCLTSPPCFNFIISTLTNSDVVLRGARSQFRRRKGNHVALQICNIAIKLIRHPFQFNIYP